MTKVAASSKWEAKEKPNRHVSHPVILSEAKNPSYFSYPERKSLGQNRFPLFRFHFHHDPNKESHASSQHRQSE